MEDSTCSSLAAKAARWTRRWEETGSSSSWLWNVIFQLIFWPSYALCSFRSTQSGTVYCLSVSLSRKNNWSSSDLWFWSGSTEGDCNGSLVFYVLMGGGWFPCMAASCEHDVPVKMEVPLNILQPAIKTHLIHLKETLTWHVVLSAAAGWTNTQGHKNWVVFDDVNLDLFNFRLRNSIKFPSSFGTLKK